MAKKMRKYLVLLKISSWEMFKINHSNKNFNLKKSSTKKIDNLMKCKRKNLKRDKNLKHRPNYFRINKLWKNKNKRIQMKKIKIKNFKELYKIRNSLRKSNNKNSKS